MHNNTVMWSPGVTLEAIEKQAILAAFRHFRGNKTATANSLGIAIRTLDNKLEKYEADSKVEEKTGHDASSRREDFLKRQRGFTTGVDGTITHIAGGEPRNVQKESGPNAERASDDNAAQAGLHMESASQPSAEQSVPLPVGSEVQSVSPRVASAHRGGKRR